MSNYIKVRIDKLWHGFASIRDYLVKEAIQTHKGLEIHFNKEVMYLSYDKLDKGFENEDVFTSKHTEGLRYQLIDYDWKPIKLPVQEKLL